MEKGLQNLGRSLLGHAVKAVLCIRAVDSIGADEVEQTVQQTNDLNKELMEMAQKSLTPKPPPSPDVEGEDSEASSVYKDIKGKAEGKGYIALEVQYNPTTLRLTTSAGMQTDYSGDAGDVAVQTISKPASTELSFELLFDDMNIQDSFMLSDNILTNMSTGALLSQGKDIVNKIRVAAGDEGGKYSVQRQMDGLMGLLTRVSTRQVIFFWGSMSFRGEVTAANSTYTMFNKDGYPVRGKIGMTIRQGAALEAWNQNSPEAKYAYEDSYWKAAFDKCWTTDIKEQSMLSRFNNNITNLKL